MSSVKEGSLATAAVNHKALQQEHKVTEERKRAQEIGVEGWGVGCGGKGLKLNGVSIQCSQLKGLCTTNGWHNAYVSCTVGRYTPLGVCVS